MINLKINDIPVAVKEGATILDAAKKLGIRIPTLCYHQDLCIAGNCRVCLVEVKNSRTLQASCAIPVFEGMEIHTNTLKVRNARKNVIELLLSEHRSDCLKCYKNSNCELQDLASEYRIEEKAFLDVAEARHVDRSSPSIEKDDSKCIRCQRCVRTCSDLQ
ncbi:MAG: 2Fe-2S iron-sulfur cluster-binding protein, partial [Calditrichia bacterium]